MKWDRDNVLPSSYFREQCPINANQRVSLSNQSIEEGTKMSKPDFTKLPAETLCQWRADIDECIERLRELEARARALANAEAIEDLKAKYIEMANNGWHISHAE